MDSRLANVVAALDKLLLCYNYFIYVSDIYDIMIFETDHLLLFLMFDIVYDIEAIFTLVAECLGDIRSVLLSVMICYSTTVRLRYCRLIV